MIGSKVIANGSKHLAKDMPKTSHIALLINDRWVHEATGHGVLICSYDLWKQRQTEVARIPLKSREYKEIADQFRSIKDKKYDYPGVFFLGLCIIPTFLGFKLRPKKNLWESKNKYFCCEVVGYLTGHYYGMSSPIQILKALNEC
jgi:hypothetical protein